jgi:hypothetical protein
MASDRSDPSEDPEAKETPTADRSPSAPVPDNPGSPGVLTRAEARARLAELDRKDEPSPSNDEGKAEASDDSSTMDTADAKKGYETGEKANDQDIGKNDENLRQRTLGEELGAAADKKVDREIDETLDKVNPKYDPTKSAYSENCTGVVQANDLRRRGYDVEAGPLEGHLRMDQGGPGGRALDSIEDPWGRKFTDGTKSEIEDAFREPGARGIVYIRWHSGGAHVFNVENVGGKVRFVDGQPTPPITDASNYFNLGSHTKYVRLDDLRTADPKATRPYLEP